MAFKKIKPTTMNELTMNVFMLLVDFDPDSFSLASGVIDGSKIIASTTGGVTFTDKPEYIDFGGDIDNCPKNTMELKVKKDGEAKVSGNLVTVNSTLFKMLIGAADVTGNKITPRTDLSMLDFTTLWGIADYGKGGLIAIKMKRVLNTSGLSITTTDDSKGQFAFEFTCHKTLYDLEDPPYEVYVLDSGSTNAGIELNWHSLTIGVGDTVALVADTVPANTNVTWRTSSNNVVTIGDGTVTGSAQGYSIITATITVDDVQYTDTCTVIVEEANDDSFVINDH